VVSIDGAPRFLIDAGPGTFLRLGELGLDLERLDTVLLTHFHIDHSGDVPGFVKSRDLSYDHALTFRFYGPEGGGVYPGTRAFVDSLFGPHGAFGCLRDFRNELTLDPHELPSRADAPVQEIVHEGDLRVTSIAVDHGDVPAVAYRIERGAHAVVVSGDLASRNDNLIRLAQGADLLVYDTTVRDPPAAPPVLYTLHTTPRRIGEVAAAAHVGAVLLSHLPDGVEAAQDELLRSIRGAYHGSVRLASDCMRVSLADRP
jgi:ribonuclease BN (tRNA processing enzyme)